MGNVKEKRVSSFRQTIAFIDSRQSKTPYSLWYRGCGKADNELTPTLYRHSTKKTVEQWAKLEADLIARFRQRSIPFHDRSLADDWDALFFMQHFGTPTRLLDWTENPLIALYFAVMTAQTKRLKNGEIRFKSDAAVWVLDPVLWNRKSLDHVSFDGEVLSPGDESLKGYKPAPSFSGIPVYYWLIRKAEDTTHIREFLVAFEADRKANRELINANPTSKKIDEELTRFDGFNRNTNDEASHEGRFKILASRFDAFLAAR